MSAECANYHAFCHECKQGSSFTFSHETTLSLVAKNLKRDFDATVNTRSSNWNDDEASEWSTVADDEEERDEDVVVEEKTRVDCHEIVGKSVFELPPDLVFEPCPICFENIDKMINVVVNRCGHAFHASCMFEALDHAPGCPMCRVQLVQDYDEESDGEEEEEEEDGEEEEEEEDEDEGSEGDDQRYNPYADDYDYDYRFSFRR